VSVIRVEISEEVAKRLAIEAAGRGTSTENLAAEVLSRHVPQSPPTYRVPRFVGKDHSGRHDLSERVEEILSSELGA
jgi:plasmid stability protein